MYVLLDKLFLLQNMTKGSTRTFWTYRQQDKTRIQLIRSAVYFILLVFAFKGSKKPLHS